MPAQATVKKQQGQRRGWKHFQYRRAYLESASQELVLDFQKVALANVHLKRLIDDGKPDVILDVLPPAVAMSYDSSKQPVIVSAVIKVDLVCIH